METTRSNVHHALTRPVQLTVRPITLGLVALLATVAVTLAIVLAASGGSENADPGYTKSVRVAPSAHVPNPDERNQKPGLNGPGMRP
jgi:hypothetical protein